MAHEIEEFDNLFYIQGNTPWHGLGTPVPQAATSKEAILAANLGWNVFLRPVSYFESENMLDDEVYTVNDHFVVMREDTKDALGVVGGRYTPIQNTEAFEFMDNLVSDGSMRYHTAGSMRNGRRVWLLGKIGSFEVVPNDRVDKYLFLYNSHDGSGTLKVMFTPVRVVCANTARMALSGAKNNAVSIRHTGSVTSKLEASKRLLGLAEETYSSYEEFTRYISKINLNNNKLEEMLKVIVPQPNEKALRAVTLAENKRNNIIKLFETGIGQDISGVSGTGWALYNAVTEYMNYHSNVRGKTEIEKQNKRFENIMFSNNYMLDKTISVLMAA